MHSASESKYFLNALYFISVFALYCILLIFFLSAHTHQMHPPQQLLLFSP